jgi:tetratricopeptide (TPR) repeat protein
LRELDDLKEAITQARKLVALEPEDWLSSWYLAQTHFTQATKERKSELFRKAIPELQSALGKIRRKQAANLPNPALAVAATEIMCVLTRCYAEMGDYRSAEQVGSTAYRELQDMIHNNPTRTVLTGYQLALFTDLPNAIYESGQHKKALELSRQIASDFLDIIAKLPVGFSRIDAYFGILMTSSTVLRRCRDLEGATAVAERGRELIDRFQKEDPNNHLFAEISAEAWTNIAKNRIRAPDHESTIRAMREAIAWEEKALKLHPDQARVPVRLDDRWGRLGRFLASIERWDEAEEVMRTRENLWPKSSEGLRPLKNELQKLCTQIRESKPAPNSKIDQLAKRWDHKIAELESRTSVSR